MQQQFYSWGKIILNRKTNILSKKKHFYSKKKKMKKKKKKKKKKEEKNPSFVTISIALVIGYWVQKSSFPITSKSDICLGVG